MHVGAFGITYDFPDHFDPRLATVIERTSAALAQKWPSLGDALRVVRTGPLVPGALAQTQWDPTTGLPMIVFSDSPEVHERLAQLDDEVIEALGRSITAHETTHVRQFQMQQLGTHEEMFRLVGENLYPQLSVRELEETFVNMPPFGASEEYTALPPEVKERRERLFAEFGANDHPEMNLKEAMGYAVQRSFGGGIGPLTDATIAAMDELGRSWDLSAKRGEDGAFTQYYDPVRYLALRLYVAELERTDTLPEKLRESQGTFGFLSLADAEVTTVPTNYVEQAEAVFARWTDDHARLARFDDQLTRDLQFNRWDAQIGMSAVSYASQEQALQFDAFYRESMAAENAGKRDPSREDRFGMLHPTAASQTPPGRWHVHRLGKIGTTAHRQVAYLETLGGSTGDALRASVNTVQRLQEAARQNHDFGRALDEAGIIDEFARLNRVDFADMAEADATALEVRQAVREKAVDLDEEFRQLLEEEALVGVGASPDFVDGSRRRPAAATIVEPVAAPKTAAIEPQVPSKRAAGLEL